MYDVNIILCVLTADTNNRQQYVLSARNDTILFPSFKPIKCNDIIDNIHTFLNSCFNNYTETLNIFLIDINSNNINSLFDSNNTINIVYGAITPKYTTAEPYVWQDFSFNDLSIPNELSIIGESIRRAF